MDKEYIILESIYENDRITQRELSKATGISLGSVNLLLAKMIKEGLIKVEKIPANRVAYMLTPKGMLEKINKTYNYIRIHYNQINKTKERIKKNLLSLSAEKGRVVVILENDELSEITKTAVQELQNNNILYESEIDDLTDGYVIVLNKCRYLEISERGYSVKYLLEVI